MDTGDPIEGAVALGVWFKEAPTVAGAVSTYYDARETMTDKNGEFEIPGHGLRIMTNLAPMNIMIFKAGYTYFGTYTWNEFKRTVKYVDDKPVVRLRKLTMEERRKSETFPDYPPIDAPKEKTRLIMEEIYKERKERGLER